MTAFPPLADIVVVEESSDDEMKILLPPLPAVKVPFCMVIC